jgi:hypothetical protein
MNDKQINQLLKKIDKLQARIEDTKSELDGELNVLYHMTGDLYYTIDQARKKTGKLKK